MTAIRVPLSRRYVGHGAGTQVALVREPTGGLYLDHGEPVEAQRTTSGERVAIENLSAIRAYVEACTSFEGEADASAILGQLGVADIRAVKDAVLGFFKATGTSETSSTSSPSAPDGPPMSSSE